MLDVELQSYGKGSNCSYKIIFEQFALCELTLSPPCFLLFLPLVEAWLVKGLGHSWLHPGLQKARHKKHARAQVLAEILKTNRNWKQIPKSHISLEHAKLVISTRFSFISILISYINFGMNRNAELRITPSAWVPGRVYQKGLMFCSVFFPRTPLKGSLVWHAKDILLLKFQIFTNRAALKRQGFLGREPCGREVHEYIWIIN